LASFQKRDGILYTFHFCFSFLSSSPMTLSCCETDGPSIAVLYGEARYQDKVPHEKRWADRLADLLRRAV
jgi:hypothetical protein